VIKYVSELALISLFEVMAHVLPFVEAFRSSAAVGEVERSYIVDPLRLRWLKVADEAER
jgi:hypothetical protein